MFLKQLKDRNPRLLEVSVALHQAGDIPPNSYVIDLDALEDNTRHLTVEAHALDLTVYAMTKQLGRAPGVLDAMIAGGADGFVAVDMDCARSIVRNNHPLGHLGHLVQIAKSEVDEAVAMHPSYWTVFSQNKVSQAAAAAHRVGRVQDMLVRVFDSGDIFYPGHEGGVAVEDLPAMINYINSLEGARFAGLTTFPALLFDDEVGQVATTPNVETLARAADLAVRCPGVDRDTLQINTPGTTSTVTLSRLAEAGSTQVEPGHGLTGTTPLHAVEKLPEIPAVLYLSEVAHIHFGTPFCFGGGLYIDPVFGPYKTSALIAHDPAEVEKAPIPVDIPDSAAIDYYAKLHPPEARKVEEGATVIFGFRIQAFVTRARIVGLSGVQRGQAGVVGIWNSFGELYPTGVSV